VRRPVPPTFGENGLGTTDFEARSDIQGLLLQPDGIWTLQTILDRRGMLCSLVDIRCEHLACCFAWEWL
jgi:hypothetical protein